MSDASSDPSTAGDDGGLAPTPQRGGHWARSAARSTIGAVVLVGAFYAFPDTAADEGLVSRLVIFTLCLVGLGALIVYLVRRAQSSEDVRIDTLVLTLLAAMVVFAQTYYALAQSSGQMDGLVTRTDALYFTVTALSTIGFGDIHASGQAARVVVIIQVLFAAVFLGAATTTIRGVLRSREHRRTDRRRSPPAA